MENQTPLSIKIQNDYNQIMNVLGSIESENLLKQIKKSVKVLLVLKHKTSPATVFRAVQKKLNEVKVVQQTEN